MRVRAVCVCTCVCVCVCVCVYVYVWVCMCVCVCVCVCVCANKYLGTNKCFFNPPCINQNNYSAVQQNGIVSSLHSDAQQ